MRAMPRVLRRKRGLRSTATVALAAALMIASAGAATAYISGPDAASYQHPDGASVNWDAVRDSGQSFAFIKATEGDSGNYVNPYFASDARAVKAAGMYLGTYHYARPSVSSGSDRYASAVAQARYYVQTLGNYAKVGNLPPALDYEDTLSGLNPTDLINWAQSWLDTVQQLTGRTPIVYAANWYWRDYLANTTQFAGYPAWVANYTDAAQPVMFGGWDSWIFWQYTDAGRIAGIQAPVDLNRFHSNAKALAALAGGSTPVIKPAVADLQVSVSAPLHTPPGQNLKATVTVTNHGPASAASTTASLVPLGAFTALNRGAGTATNGASTDFTTPLLPAGQSQSYTVTLRADGPLGALLAFAPTSAADPDLFNNFGVTPVVGF
jgi:GH25 family lysozyme M1 (1,4-beta-N-acetylmuramidase)